MGTVISCKFSLGDTVQHKRIGYTGYVRAIDMWDTGCIRLGVQPVKMTDDGKIPDMIWHEQGFFTLVTLAEDAPGNTGGPEFNPGLSSGK